jgi:hypothetical protein
VIAQLRADAENRLSDDKVDTDRDRRRAWMGRRGRHPPSTWGRAAPDPTQGRVRATRRRGTPTSGVRREVGGKVSTRVRDQVVTEGETALPRCVTRQRRPRQDGVPREVRTAEWRPRLPLDRSLTGPTLSTMDSFNR